MAQIVTFLNGGDTSCSLWTTSDFATSLEGSSEIRQHPNGQKVDAQKRLHAGNRAHPARRFEGELPGVHAGEPVADAELAKANLEGREERKPRRPSNGHEAACL